MLFLVGCIGTRSYLVYLAKTRPDLLSVMGALAVIPAIGFTLIYLFGWRKTGAEVFGDKIWWDALRPVHAALWGWFAYLALNQRHDDAWRVLFIDTLIGLVAFAGNRVFS